MDENDKDLMPNENRNRACQALLAAGLAMVAGLLTGCGTSSSELESTLSTEMANQRARQLADQGQPDMAVEILERNLLAENSGTTRNNLGTLYLRRGRKGDIYLAARQFEAAAALMPRHPAPPNNLGLVLETAVRLDEAIVEFEKAAKFGEIVDPANPEYLGNLARVRIRRGDRGDEVREVLRRLLEKLDPQAEPKWYAWATRQQALLVGEASKQPVGE